MSKGGTIAMPKTDAEYEAEYDADTMVKAEEIKNDKKRHKMAMKVLKKRKKAVDAII